MQHDFWHEKWEKNEIGFHQSVANRMLTRHLKTLQLPESARIFLPLCGKTLDIHWLLSQGYRVIGSELSALAIEQLFQELDITPVVRDIGSLKLYSGGALKVFVGDFFALTQEMLGTIDAVYDRAALVALPDVSRARYSEHIAIVTDHAPQLVISFEYDQTLMDGPPFSVDADMVSDLYSSRYNLDLLDRAELPGGLKGKYPAIETVWHLHRKAFDRA